MAIKNIKTVSIRLEEEMLKKLRVVAAYEGRSINRQIVWMVLKRIESYEKAYGEIKIMEQNPEFSNHKN